MSDLLAKLRRGYGTADGSISATQLVERGIILLFTVLRLGVTFQVGLALWFLAATPDVSPVVLVITVLTIGYSLWLVAAVNRRGEFPAWPWGIIDVTVGTVALLACSGFLPDAWKVGSWLHWAPGYLNQVAAFVPAWRRSIGRSVTVGITLGVIYVGATLPGNSGQLLAVLENGVSVALFTIAAALFASYARRVARISDENQVRAIEVATQLELAQYQFHVHNASGLLATLARPDTPAELLPSLRRQASEESNRLRNEILNARRPGGLGADSSKAVTLGTVIWDATSGFGQLPLELPISLGQGALLSQRQALVVKAALIASLYNVQFHAHASEVTVHADQSAKAWEVSVADNGVGFEPDPATYGFGLASQVLDSLEGNGLSVSISSHPGEGTCITIQGPKLESNR